MSLVTVSAGRQWAVVAASLAALLLSAIALPGSAQEGDLPGRVGRVADFAGQLVLSQQDRPDEWEPIGINYPITSGANLWVSGDGRAEVDYGGGQFRLAGDTNVHVSRLDDSELALFIAQGWVIIRVRAQEPGDATRIDTPNAQVTLTRPGLYRIDVAPDRQSTTLTVREGEAILLLGNGAQQALPGQVVSVVGPDPASADIRNTQGADGFDAWAAERDRRYARSRSAAFVSRQMVGYSDLDQHGSWQTYQEYGAVWFPTAVAPDWAPYRDGYWTEVGQWGPTWVDHAPWGYAPYHYGRWAWIGGRWGWCPGVYVARPVWAPALVAWYGGSGWGLSVRQGAPVYGWVPLGWREAYHPAWRRCSYNCWAHYNRPYAVNVTVRPTAPPARYANTAVPGAMSAVAAATLAGRRPVAPNLLQVPVSLAASAPAMAVAPPLAPPVRQAPASGQRRDIPPPAASTHAAAQRLEPANARTGERPGIPGNAGSSPPQYQSIAPAANLPAQRESVRPAPPQALRPQDSAAPSVAPSPNVDPARQRRRDERTPEPSGMPQAVSPRTTAAGAAGSVVPAVPPSGAVPVSRVPSPDRVAPPPLPTAQSSSAPVARAVPAVVPPASVAPAPNAAAQAPPATPANARGVRGGGEKSAPDSPPTGTNQVR